MLQYQISEEEAKNLAREIMGTYGNPSSPYLSSAAIKDMLEDLYSTQNHKINLERDVNEFARKIDCNRDNFVDICDLESSISKVF